MDYYLSCEDRVITKIPFETIIKSIWMPYVNTYYKQLPLLIVYVIFLIEKWNKCRAEGIYD